MPVATSRPAWRATGERTAELILSPGEPIRLDAVFAPGSFIQEECMVARGPVLLRIMIEIDGTGNRLTAEGTVNGPDETGGATEVGTYTGWADRLTLAATIAATPTS